MANQSVPYSLTGEIDGMTAADMIRMLSEYPPNAVIRIVEEPDYGYGGWTDSTSLNMFIEYPNES